MLRSLRPRAAPRGARAIVSSIQPAPPRPRPLDRARELRPRAGVALLLARAPDDRVLRRGHPSRDPGSGLRRGRLALADRARRGVLPRGDLLSRDALDGRDLPRVQVALRRGRAPERVARGGGSW